MTVRRLRGFGVVLGLLLVASVAHAGQLHTDLYGLAEVVRSPGVAVLGTLLAVDAAKGTVKLLVKRVWVAPGARPELMLPRRSGGSQVSTQVTVAPGETLDLEVYQGVVWTNPRKSPIDHRVRDHLQLDALKPQQQVVLLSRELVAATPAELRKLELFFAPEGIAAYLARAELSQLRTDLEDFDLSPLAAAELERRHALDAATLLAIADATRRSGRLYERWRALDADGRAAFLGELRRRLESAPAPERAAEVLRMVAYELTPPMLPDVAALALMLPPGEADPQRQIARSVEELRAQPGAPVSAEVVRLLLAPHLAQPDREELVRFAATLRPAERALVEDALLDRLQAAIAGPGGEAAERAMSQLAAVVLAQPSSRLAPRLAQLDATRLRFAPRTSVAIDLVEVAVALAAQDPSVIPVLKPALERLLASDSGTENMTTQQGEDGTSFSIGIVQTVESMMNSNAFDTYQLRFRGQRR